MSHEIYISVGSNIDRDKHTRAGLQQLAQHFDELRLSTVYESEAVGFQGSHFYNLVVAATTDMTVEQVFSVLKGIERDNGRVHGGKKFAPRTLDLDLLLYDDVIATEGVVLPREEICHNAFVLKPLAELAPDLIHPVTGVSLAQMWESLDVDQKLWAIEFSWSA